MKKNKVLLCALAVSVIFNLVSLYQGLKGVDSASSESVGDFLEPGIDKVLFNKSENSSSMFVTFKTDMEIDKVPVEIQPPLKFKPKWHNKKEVELILEEKTIPGKKYFVKTLSDLKDEKGHGFGGHFKEVFSQPLSVEEVSVFNRFERTEVRLRFNGEIETSNLKKYVTLSGFEGKKYTFSIKQHGKKRFTLQLPSLKEKKITLKIQKDLKANLAEKSLEKEFVKELTLDKSLKLVSINSRENQSRIYLELTFNRLVDLDAIKKNLSIEPPVHFKVSKNYNDEVLLKGDFKPSSSYKLTLKAGFKAIDNSSLVQDVIKEVYTGSLNPSIEFLSKGPFYPAGRDFKLPIKVVSLSSIKVTVTKVFPNNIVRFFDTGYYSKNKVGKKVFEKEIETGLGAEGQKKIYLDLADSFSEKGIYIVTMNHGNYWNKKHLTVIRTDLGVSMAQSDKALQVWAFDLNTGLPLENVDVSLISAQNQKLAVHKSDKLGLTEFNLESISDEVMLVRLEKDGDISFRNFKNAINLSAFNMKGRPFTNSAYEAFLFSERDVCRPGETIDLSMVVRGRNKNAVGGFPLELRLFGPGMDKEFSKVVQIPESGFLSKRIKFNKGSKTGYYKFQLGIPGDEKSVLAEKDFLSNTYTADTFKVKVDKSDEVFTGSKIPISVSANYNFGGALSKSKVTLNVDYSSASLSEEKFKGYYFGDSSRKVSKSYFEKGELGENGQGLFSVDLISSKVNKEITVADLKNMDKLPSALGRLNVRVSVTDSAGETVSSRQVFNHMPYPYLIGASKEKSSKEETEIRWIRVDASMDKTESKDSIKWVLKRRKWHYAYKTNSRGDYVWDWSCERIPVKEGEVFETTKEGVFSIGILKSGLYEISLSSQKDFIRTVYEFDVGQNGSDVRLGNSEFVKLYSNKKYYKAGEFARLRFESPADGTAVLRVSDDDLHSQIVSDVKRGWNTVNFTVPKSAQGNVYTAMTLVRNLDQKLSLPPRFFGLLNIAIDNEDKRLEVSLKAPEKVEPGDSVKVNIEVKGKKPFCKIKLMAVDEGVLSLTGFKSPNPFDAFFTQKELRTKFMDVFDEMFPELHEKFSKVSLAGGGGSGAVAFKGADFDLVKSHIVTLGIHDTDENGQLDLEFKAPAFNGAMRIMAVAINDESMGHADANLIIKDKVTLIAGNVNTLTSGDVLTLPVSLFNNENYRIDGIVKVSVEGPIQLIDSDVQNVSIDPSKLTQFKINIKALKDLGAASIKLAFTSGESRSEKVIKLKVRPAYARVSLGQNGRVEKGRKQSLDFGGNFLEGSEKSTFMVSTSSASEMYTYFQQLQDYPYGCLEQTTSRAVVNLFGSQLAPAADRIKSAAIVTAAINRVKTMQTHNGGFAMWPRGESSWASATIYAGHFMAECKSHGIDVDSYVIEDLVDYLDRHSENQSNSSVVDRAYALYVLALLGKKNIQKAQSIIETPKNPILAKILACGALSRAGKNDQAADLFKTFDLSVISKEKYSWDMNSLTRRLGLSTLIALDIFGLNAQSENLCNQLLDSVRSQEWLSTQDKALVCLAAGKRAIMMKESPDSKAIVSFNGQKHEVTSKAPLFFNGLVQNPQIENSEKGPVYFSFYSSGIPLSGGQKVSEGMEIERQYLDKDGKEIKKYKVGELVQVKIKIKSTTKVDNTVILDLLPGCLTVESAYLKSRNGSFKVKNGRVKHYEGLDDRMIICTDLAAGVESEFVYTTRVIIAGTFNKCGISAEGMYKPQVRASVNSLDLMEVANEL